MLGSFVSRNNDVSGHWGLGQLYSLALLHGADRIEIDLLREAIQPVEETFRPMIENYSRMFKRQMASRNLPMEWLWSATIRVHFGTSNAGKLLATAREGDPFVCGVHLVDDIRMMREAVTFGRCWPSEVFKGIRRNPDAWDRLG